MEAKEIKKKQQECTELYKKGFNDPDNRDVVVTHLEPDILEYEVKWALGSITTNKARGGDEIPVELFQILKQLLLKSCINMPVSGKLSSGCWNGKGQFSFQSQRKAMPKKVQTSSQLCSFQCQEGNAQNPLRQTSTVPEPKTYRCTIWIQERWRNQRSICQHLLDHRKSRTPEKHLLLLH